MFVFLLRVYWASVVVFIKGIFDCRLRSLLRVDERASVADGKEIPVVLLHHESFLFLCRYLDTPAAAAAAVATSFPVTTATAADLGLVRPLLLAPPSPIPCLLPFGAAAFWKPLLTLTLVPDQRKPAMMKKEYPKKVSLVGVAHQVRRCQSNIEQIRYFRAYRSFNNVGSARLDHVFQVASV